jgi:hypothetical protein
MWEQIMSSSALFVVLTTVWGPTMPDAVIEKQQDIFHRLWNEDFEWRFDALPTEGTVEKHRMPYSGYIYPDTAGGTITMLRKYDQAFNQGRLLATSFEKRDTSQVKMITRRQTVTRRVGLFGGRTRTVTRLVRTLGVPHWYGHCNGWTAATMRHVEPQRSVMRNGVEFTPSDIKGLLAEIYIYNEHVCLAGKDYHLNPGALHAILANWLGRGKHPVAVEADPGPEKWNYPIYKYATSSMRRGNNQVEVRTTIAYAKNSRTEQDQAPCIELQRQFHYTLQLDTDGMIVGGYWYRDSGRIDLLWMPLTPKPGGEQGNERGNPHVDVDEVLAMWRDSVPELERKKWLVADPAPLDRVPPVESLARIVPVQESPPSLQPSGNSVIVASANESTNESSLVTASLEPQD